jgi:hypothetical protein
MAFVEGHEEKQARRTGLTRTSSPLILGFQAQELPEDKLL